MKKLVEIISIDEVSQCYQLEKDFECERKNLKRITKSLTLFKINAKDNHQTITNFIVGLNQMNAKHTKSQKKKSELDYYVQKGSGVFYKLAETFVKPCGFYFQIVKKIAQFEETTSKYLKQSREAFKLQKQDYQKGLKDYAGVCFPATTSFFYFLGFTDIDKITKSPNSQKESQFLEKVKKYSLFLEEELDKMCAFRKQMIALGEEYYLGICDEWRSSLTNIQEELISYTVNEDQVRDYFIQTGGADTDRSAKSNKSIQDQKDIQ